MSKINRLKEALQVETSEELFGIDKQPGNQCPTIDREIQDWERAKTDIKYYCKDLRGIDDAESIAKDIEWEIERLDPTAGFEEVRKQCENIRAWGQGWKDLAKFLLANQDDLSEFVADKYQDVLETITDFSPSKA